ncbi:MAG: hypothetical protein AB2809_13345, partial [Candidatus Thiodiazotropha sp.]
MATDGLIGSQAANSLVKNQRIDRHQYYELEAITMKNLLILIIVITGIMIVGTYLRPDETKVVQEQAKLQLQTLTKGAVESIQSDTVSDELLETKEVGMVALHSANNDQISRSLDHETASDYTKDDSINFGSELPVPPVDEVISPTNEITTASI